MLESTGNEDNDMKTVVVTAAARTAIGRFGGAFKSASALDLTIPLMQALIKRSEIEDTSV